MDLVIIMLREATQKKQINDIAYMWNPKKKKKKNKNELIYKTERDSQTQKTNSSLPKEKGSVWRGYK